MAKDSPCNKLLHSRAPPSGATCAPQCTAVYCTIGIVAGQSKCCIVSQIGTFAAAVYCKARIICSTSTRPNGLTTVFDQEPHFHESTTCKTPASRRGGPGAKVWAPSAFDQRLDHRSRTKFKLNMLQLNIYTSNRSSTTWS